MDNKIKHLEFIQQTIGRLSNNSFLIKGWSILAASAVLAIAFREDSPTAAMLAVIPIVLFWALDGYYLVLERLYRELYNDVRAKKVSQVDFSMAIDNDKNTAFAIGCAMFSGSVFIHHFGTAFLLIVAAIYL